MLEKVLNNFVDTLQNSKVEIRKDDWFENNYLVNFVGVDTRSRKRILQETANGLINLTEKFLNKYENIAYSVTKTATREDFEINLNVTIYQNRSTDIGLKIGPQMLKRKNKLEIEITGENELVSEIKGFFDNLIGKDYKLALIDEDTNKTVYRIVKPDEEGIKYLVIN